MSVDEIIVPQMIGFDRLVKIIIGYLKVGAAEEPKSYDEVAKVSSVASNNVGLNAKFFESIGMLEGEKGNYRLTQKGKQYAQALDWGKLADANSTLREILKENTLAKKALGYVDINQPVTRDDLVSQIAIIADKPKEGRYITGIQGFVEMLLTSGLLQSDSNENLTTSKEKREELVEIQIPSARANRFKGTDSIRQPCLRTRTNKYTLPKITTPPNRATATQTYRPQHQQN